MASALAAGFLPAIPLLPGLLPSRTLVWRDAGLLEAPVRRLVVDALRAGRLPLWNPYEAGGEPLLGQGIHGVLHPISVATALLTANVKLGLDLSIVLYVSAAGIGAFTLTRMFKTSPAASLVSALAYAMSGFVLGMTTNLPYLRGAAGLPWQVAGILAASRRGAPGIALCALATAAAVLGGDMESVAVGAVVGIAWAVVDGGWRGMVRSLLGTALGAVVSSVQLVPFSVTYSQTSRAFAGLTEVAHSQWALSPFRLIEWIAPGFFVGKPSSWTAPVFVALGGPSAQGFPFAPSVFVGAPVLLLALAGWRRGRRSRAVAVTALGLLWLAMGHYSGATQVTSWIPIWSAFRYAEKLMGPLSLCLAILAAIGAERSADGAPRWLVRTAALVSAVSAAGALGCALAHSHPDPAATALSHLRIGLLHAAIASGALAAWLALRSKVGRWLPWGLAALAFVEGLAAAPFALHLGAARAYFGEGPALEASAPGPRLLTPIEVSNPVSGELDPIDAEALIFNRTGRAPSNVAHRIDNFESYTGVGSLRATLVVLTAAPLKWWLARRFAATHVVAPARLTASEESEFRLASEGGRPIQAPEDLRAVALPHRAWASFAPRVIAAASIRDAALTLGRLASASDLETAVAETDAPLSTASGRVLSVDREETAARIEAESTGPGFLVVNDAWDPGWEATLDGARAQLIPTDVLVRGVEWPAGRHVLEMRYAPPEVPLGKALSACGLAVLGGLVLASVRRGRRKPRASSGDLAARGLLAEASQEQILQCVADRIEREHPAS